MDRWNTQKAHITTHNLFKSAVFGEKDTGLVDHGFRMVGDFMYVPGERTSVDVEPPYTLLGENSAIFFDFIRPGNISEEAIKRLSKYNKISLKAVESHVKRSPVSEDFLEPEDIDWFDHCTILREEQFRNHQSGSANQREKLKRLKQESSIATVSPGSSLSLESGSLRNSTVLDQLQRGISVPESPPSLVYLTRDIHDEPLALGICEEIVLGSDLSDGGIIIDFEDVKTHFGRNIKYKQLEDVFTYLRKIDICRKRRDDGRFLFTKYKINNLMSLRDRFEDETINEYLSDEDESKDDDLSSLSDFT
ncbi:hypothetical protein [Natrinema versiforme]|uniref:hypothetical protein n=1 Tax=Natrinema versiforme TaxID=88724 RepID=UPI0012684618|nr:hypothetical protein [Natrinema versiforme]